MNLYRYFQNKQRKRISDMAGKKAKVAHPAVDNKKKVVEQKVAPPKPARDPRLPKWVAGANEHNLYGDDKGSRICVSPVNRGAEGLVGYSVTAWLFNGYPCTHINPEGTASGVLQLHESLFDAKRAGEKFFLSKLAA